MQATPPPSVPIRSPEPTRPEGTSTQAATAASTISPTETPAPGAPSTSFQFGDRVTDVDRALITTGVELALMQVEAASGEPEPELLVLAHSDRVALAGALSARGGFGHPFASPLSFIQRISVTTAEAFPGRVVIYTGSSTWQSWSAVQQLRIAAHEFFHTVQLHLIGPELARDYYQTPVDEVRLAGPAWLFEGAADYVAWKALEAVGLADLETFLLGRTAPDLELRQLEKPIGFTDVAEGRRVILLEAVALLVNDEGIGVLLQFYEALGGGTPWQEAFELSFGRPIEHFYVEYALNSVWFDR